MQLQTKTGATGHIKEPVGTHGHMKCIFDRPLSAADVVLMPLYKRVFPKWIYEPEVQKLFDQSILPNSTQKDHDLWIQMPETLQLTRKKSTNETVMDQDEINLFA